ncbi:MAG: nuclear transport factor 2 family protein [Enterovibrio sp.]
MSQLVANFVHFYQELDKSTLHRLADLYDEQIVFDDPVHQVVGLAALERYFAGMYENLAACQFEILHAQQQDSHAALRWRMHYRHAKLQNGEPRTLAGASFLVFGANGKIVAQQDHYDLGAMIYEALPILGPAIRLIKKRLTL